LRSTVDVVFLQLTTSMKFLLLTCLVLAALAVVTPQQQGQRRPGNRQQQQGAQRRQGQGQGRRQQQQNRRPQAQQIGGGQGGGDLETVVLRDNNNKVVAQYRLDPTLTLSKIDDADLNLFMQNKLAVKKLVDCFESLRKCDSRAGRSLVRDVRRLGPGGSCNKREQCSDNLVKANVENLVKNAIRILQSNHQRQWRRLLPHISFIISA